MNRKKEKGVDTCAVKTCVNLRGRDDITFFRFPLNPERSKLWIKACHREDLEGKESRTLYENCRVCSKHFTDTMFCSEKKKRLNSGAIPTLYLNTAITAQCQYPSASTSRSQFVSSCQVDILQTTSSIELEQSSTSLLDESFTSTSSIIHPITCSTAKRKAENQFCGIEKRRRLRVHDETIISPTSSLHVCTQTATNLSSSSPRKNKLKHKIDALKKENERLKNKIKNMEEKKVKLSAENLMTAIDQFLPLESAQFFKVQVQQFMKKTKRKKI